MKDGTCSFIYRRTTRKTCATKPFPLWWTSRTTATNVLLSLFFPWLLSWKHEKTSSFLADFELVLLVILQHHYWLPLYVSKVHLTCMCSLTVGLTPWRRSAATCSNWHTQLYCCFGIYRVVTWFCSSHLTAAHHEKGSRSFEQLPTPTFASWSAYYDSVKITHKCSH